MTRALWIAALAACGGSPAIAPPPARPVVVPPPATTTLVFRQRHGASRTTFELALDGDRATLVETDEHADGSAWTVRARHLFRGTRHGGDLELASDDQQSLALHCDVASIDVPRADSSDDCRHARTTVRIDVTTCMAPGQTAADADADDELVFAAAPGVEWLDAACGGGLRQSSP